MIKKVRKIKRIVKESLIFYRSYHIKKDNKIWVFGAIRGKEYMDNAKYLFEYVHQYTDIQAIWISKDKELVDELQSKKFNAFYEYTPEARYYAARAKVAVITHRGSRTKADLPFYTFSKKTEIIQLWHGIPLKKIAFDDKVFSFKQDENNLKWKVRQFLKKTFLPYLHYVHTPSLILALSKDTQDIFSNAFRIPKEKVVITGYPRNDILLKNISNKNETSNKKKIIYMPTFRGSVNSNFDLFLQYGFDVEKLDLFLSKEKMQLDIKLHPFNQPSIELIEKLEKSINICFLDHDSIYEIISEYDMLITDYSSIYFDYLLLDRPIIFAPFDKEIYLKKDREFYFNYDAVTPGPKAINWIDVMGYLKKFNNSSTLYDKERRKIKDRFHMYQDDNSRQRVYETISKVLAT